MFRRLAEREVHRGRRIAVAVGTFEAPDGSTFERDVVHHPGAVGVVPVVAGGRSVLLVRQYRAPIDRELLEIPAGLRDVDDEAPERTAHRELAEEVGKEADRIEQLARFYNSAGFCDEETWVFMASDLTDCATSAQGIEEQHMAVEEVALDDIPAMIANGELRDAKTVVGLCLARARLISG